MRHIADADNAPVATTDADRNGRAPTIEEMLDILVSTMDTWEEVVTRRMHAAIASIVSEARKEVMEVRFTAIVLDEMDVTFEYLIYGMAHVAAQARPL
jgi:ATP:corrinoid adenosyltransferase